MSDILAVLVFLVFIFVILKFYPKSKQEIGSIQLKSGSQYDYLIGDGLAAYDRIFNGIQVSLPKTLPHIYLDSHGDSRTRGPRLTYHNSQQLKLEGNFNNYFQLFVPKQYHNLALSIITPDVMQTLINASQSYDVEIKSNYINIISKKRIGTKQEIHAELVAAATQLAEEIDHKLKSWSFSDEEQATGSQLTYYDEEAVKVFGRYYGIGRFSMAASFIVGLIFYILAFYFWKQESAEPMVLLGLAILVFPGFPAILFYMKRGQ